MAIYAIQPQVAFAPQCYERIRELLSEQTRGEVGRASNGDLLIHQSATNHIMRVSVGEPAGDD